MEKINEIFVYSDGRLSCGDATYKCAMGRGGVTNEKHEGDGATPPGTFPIRKVLYRSDRLDAPATELVLEEITATMGWCDDAAKEEYNRQVTLPFDGGHEKLWREDHIYDIICILGYNDEPIEKGKGSAIFMHLSRENYTPTEGCVALSLEGMTALLKSVSSSVTVTILQA